MPKTRGMSQPDARTPAPTTAGLVALCQTIDDMVTFSNDGEMLIDGKPVTPEIEQFAIAVHELTSAIVGGTK